MNQDDHSIIRVGEDRIGLRGLKSAIKEISQSHADKTDDEISQALLKKLGEMNYIAASSRNDYGKALLREYRKNLGQAVDDEESNGLNIIVLGPGCAQCDRLEKLVRQVLNEMGLAAAVDHVTDLKEIAAYGIIGTPALVINGKIVSKGTVPTARKLKEILTTANG